MLSMLAIAAVLNVQAADTGAAYRACAEIEGRRARLRCYDEAAASDAVLLAEAQAEAEAIAVAEDAERAAEAARQDAERLAAEMRSAESTAPAAALSAEERLAAAEQRVREAEAALAAANERAETAEERAGPKREAFNDDVDALGYGADRTLIIRLRDGSVWRQIRDDRTVDEDDLQQIQRAYVTPGALGSWRMTLEPLGRTIKVRPRALDPRAGVDN